MDDEFADQTYMLRQSAKKPFMVHLILSTGLVSSETQANYLLLGIAAAGLIIAGVLFYSGSGSPKGLGESDIQRIIQLQQGAAPNP